LAFLNPERKLPKNDQAWVGALLLQDALRDVKRTRQVLDWLQKGLSKRGRK
jgi:hypothetical protein